MLPSRMRRQASCLHAPLIDLQLSLCLNILQSL